MATSGIVPIIDVSPFLQGDSSARAQVAEKLVDAAKNVGFFFISGYQSSISEETVKSAFAKSDDFFALPREKKDELAWETPASNRGYVSQGRERVSQLSKEEVEALRESTPDYKETMEIGEDKNVVSKWPNRWPAESDVPGFKDFMNDFFVQCHNLHIELMRALASGLGLEENFFDDKCDQQAHNLRLLNYPSIESSKLQVGGAARAGSHSDYGTLTLLFQDSVGGLEVQDKSGNFVPAVPVPETIVVNVGDLLQRWSNDVLKSTIHRVVLPSGHGAEMTPKRQSIAYFSNPNLRQIVSALPGTGEPKYEPIESEKYLIGRLSATYA